MDRKVQHSYHININVYVHVKHRPFSISFLVGDMYALINVLSVKEEFNQNNN